MFSIQRMVARKNLLEQIKREERAAIERQKSSGSKAARVLGIPTDFFTSAKKKSKSVKRSRSFPRSASCQDPIVERLCMQQKIVSTKFYLSASHVRALRVTWAKISRVSRNSGRGKVTMMQQALNRAEKRDKFLRTIYYKSAVVTHDKAATSRDHANFLACWFDDVIARVNAANEDHQHVSFKKSQRSVLVDLPIPEVAKHAALKKWGMNSNHWEILGECLCETIFSSECIRAYPDAPKAWRIFLATLIDVLRAEFDRFRPPPPSAPVVDIAQSSSLPERLSKTIIEEQEET